MLESNIILGTGYSLGCESYKHAIITQNWETWPCAVPIVYSSDYDLDKIPSEMAIQTALLFSPNQHSAGRWTYNTPVSIIKSVDIKPLSGNHKVLTISEFDLGRWDRIREFIHDVGGISFVIEYEAGRHRASKSVRAIENLFKYSALFYYNGWASHPLEGEDDRLVCIITLLDLPYCVPVFNTRKVDGIGLSFSAATVVSSKRNGVLSRIFQADFVFSNYEDNVFTIDGASVNMHRPTDSNIFTEMESMSSQTLQIKKMSHADGGKSKPNPYVQGYEHATSSKKKPAGYKEWAQEYRGLDVGEWGSKSGHVELGGSIPELVETSPVESTDELFGLVEPEEMPPGTTPEAPPSGSIPDDGHNVKFGTSTGSYYNITWSGPDDSSNDS